VIADPLAEQATERSSGARRTLTIRAALLGVCLAAAAILGAHWSQDVQTRIGLALFLALTACVYPGALLAQSASMWTAAAEFAVGGLVFVCAWLGLALGAAWLAVGYALHGGWDWLHHCGRVPTKVAAWFPPACAAFDFVVALYALFAA